MTYSDSKKVPSSSKIIGTMFGAYGQANDSQRQAIYCKTLEDIPAELLQKAVKKLLLESKFLPSIAEIVEASRSVVGTLDESCRMKNWDEAWSEIERAMRSTPWGATPVFSRPEIATAVRNYGWQSLQTCLAEDINTVRAQMRRMYDEACARSKEQSNNVYVLGETKTVLPAATRVQALPGRCGSQGFTAAAGVIAQSFKN